MKDKILPDSINSKSLNELTDIAGRIIEKLEKANNLESLAEDYKNLIKLNNIMKFHLMNILYVFFIQWQLNLKNYLHM